MFDSRDTFEEVLSQRLAGMYGFALFVAGDEAHRAQALLVASVEEAFAHHLDGEDAATALDRAFLDQAMRSPEPRTLVYPPSLVPSPGARRTMVALSPSALRRAASRLPIAARLAIWMVMVERRTYADTARLLEVDLDHLSRLLEWRDSMISIAVSGARGRGGKRWGII